MNLAIVFLLTGLWHGASFNFILWGGVHGLFQIIERLKLRFLLERHKICAHVYTMLVVIFGWVIFRSDNLIQAGIMIRRMILPWEYTQSNLIFSKVFDNKTVLIIAAGVLGSGLVQQLTYKVTILKKWKYSYLEIMYCGVIFILCIAMLASNTYNPFIYFRF